MPVDLTASSRHHASAKRRALEWERLARRDKRRALSLAERQPQDLPNLKELLTWSASDESESFNERQWNQEALVEGAQLALCSLPSQTQKQALARLAQLARAISSGHMAAAELVWSSDAIATEEHFELNALGCSLASLDLLTQAPRDRRLLSMALHGVGEALAAAGPHSVSLKQLFGRMNPLLGGDADGPLPLKHGGMARRWVQAWFSNRAFLDGLLVFRKEPAGSGKSRINRPLPSRGLRESAHSIAQHGTCDPKLSAWALGRLVKRAKELGLALEGVFKMDGDVVRISLAQATVRGLQSRAHGPIQTHPSLFQDACVQFALALRECGVDFFDDEIISQKSGPPSRGAEGFVQAMDALREQSQLDHATPKAPAPPTALEDQMTNQAPRKPRL
jgi:hypothetical protein